MSLSIKFPLYGSTLVTGPYNVSLSFPGINSIISKSIGLNEKTTFLFPNIEYIKKFIEGNLGITDSVIKTPIYQSLSNPILSESEELTKKFLENTNTGIGDDINKLKDKKTGRIKVKESDIKLDLPNDIGLKVMETIALKSIFETQKPYMELASIIIDSLIDIEDIIARVAPLVSISPLTTKSRKPSTNSGNSGGPKALGYKGSGIKQSMKELNNLISGGVGSDNNGNIIQNSDTDETISNSANSKVKYQIISTVYSTGVFDPTVNYTYTYIDLPAEKLSKKDNIQVVEEEEDLLDKYKPKNLIFGFYDKDGNPIDPNEKLKVKVVRDGRTEEVDSPFRRASWLVESEKWRLENGLSEYNSIGSPFYVWTKGNKQKVSNTQPKGYSLKKYKKGEKNILTKREAIEGSPVISRFETDDTSVYNEYYGDLLSFGLYQSNLSKQDQNEIKSGVVNVLDIPNVLENMVLYGQLSRNSIYKQDGIYSNGFPNIMKKVFKPVKIYSTGAESDEKLRNYALSRNEQPGFIWIDPETDYKLKVIKVEASKSIEVISDDTGVKEIRKISRTKNSNIFRFSDNRPFNVLLTKRSNRDVLSENNITEFNLTNWNYPSNNDVPNNIETYDIEIWGNEPTEFYRKNTNYTWTNRNKIRSEVVKEGSEYFYREYNENQGNRKISASGIITLYDKSKVVVKNEKIIKWIYYERNLGSNNLAILNQQKTFIIDSNTLEVTDDTIPLSSFSMQFSNNNGPGRILTKSDVIDSKLINNKMSNGKYGHGTIDDPQEVEIIKRLMLTESDVETYYIIEGILDENDEDEVDPNSNTKKFNAGNYYGIKDALGIIRPFIKLVIRIVSKLIPQAQELLALLKGPAPFITEILIGKLTEHFGPLSNESIKKLTEVLNKGRESYRSSNEYIRSREKEIKNSKLKNYVFVDTVTGELRTLIDGSALIPFRLFGKDLSFGMDIKMIDILKRPPVKLIFPDIKIKSLFDNLQFKRPPFKGKTNNNNTIPSLSNGSLSTEEALRKLDTSYPFNTQFNVREEIVDIKYSTGEYIPGVDYNYIYINEDVKILLDQIDELVEKGDRDSILKANQLINQAIDLDSKNNFLKNKKKELMDLLNSTGLTTQPLLKLLLGVTTLPVKIVAGIVEYIINFFKSLVNPFTLPAKIVEFLSFKWILTFFTPKGILDMAGIKFDPLLIKTITARAFLKGPNGNWLEPDDKEIENIGDIMNIAVVSSLPLYTYGMVRLQPNILSLPLRPILCLIEKIINAIINFIWSIIGIEAIIKAPQIKLCSSDNSLSPEQLSRIINNDNIDDLLNSGTDDENGLDTGSGLDQFIYEIKLPNGEIIQKASLEELNTYIEQNKDFKYEKNF